MNVLTLVVCLLRCNQFFHKTKAYKLFKLQWTSRLQKYSFRQYGANNSRKSRNHKLTKQKETDPFIHHSRFMSQQRSYGK